MRTFPGSSKTQTDPQRPASFPLLSPFFDLGPTFFLPSLDGCLVPLARSVYWLLATPTAGLQDAADMSRMIGDPEVVSNQGGHSGLGPHLPWEAERFRPLGQ